MGVRLNTAALFGLAASRLQPAESQQIDYAVRTTTAFEADRRQDTVLAESPTHENLFINLAPRALIEIDRAWTGYVRGRIFLPTGRLAPFDSSEADDPNPARAFAGLNEFWIQYNGLTSYPGESVRLGRQHIRQSDGEWWDRDADALRWIFDTTLLNAEAGVAHQLSTYRTDDAPVPLSQRDRTYWFGNLAADWRAGDRVGLRVTHSVDSVSLTPVGSPIEPDTKLQDAQLPWGGLYASNGFYELRRADTRMSYAAEINYLRGHQVIAARDTDGTVASHVDQDVGAWQASVGLRWQLLAETPLQLGGSFAYSEGGESNGRSRQYQQSGMQSNASYFSGTQTLIGRYNETLRAELGNLLAATVFVSLNLDSDDVSLVLTRFTRDVGTSPISTEATRAAPINNDRDIGVGVDVVFTHHFERAQRLQRLLDRGDAFTAQQRRSLVSLRASAFEPGEAYGSDARTDYRMLLEVTLWLD